MQSKKQKAKKERQERKEKAGRREGKREKTGKKGHADICSFAAGHHTVAVSVLADLTHSGFMILLLLARKVW